MEVTGDNIPPPIQTFAEAKLHDVLLANIQRAGFDHPTPVQKHSLTISAARRDVMGCAQTGSGKTAAFLFPLLNRLLTEDIEAPPIFRERGCVTSLGWLLVGGASCLWVCRCAAARARLPLLV